MGLKKQPIFLPSNPFHRLFLSWDRILYIFLYFRSDFIGLVSLNSMKTEDELCGTGSMFAPGPLLTQTVFGNMHQIFLKRLS